MKTFKHFIIESLVDSCHENEKNPFKFTNSYYNGDFHQAIMDIGYCWWQNDKVKSREEMIEKMDKDFGYKFALLLLLGGYNYQVCNGGHIQYWDNGYASVGSSGFGGDHKDTELHYKMIEWFKKAGLDNTLFGKKILDIMESAEDVFEDMLDDPKCSDCNGEGEVEDTCYDCNGDGQIYDNCPECGGEDDDCPECNGSGEIEIDCETCEGEGVIYNTCEYCGGEGEEDFSYQLNILDKKYYECKDWEYNVNKFAKDIIFEKFPEDAKNYDAWVSTKKYNI